MRDFIDKSFLIGIIFTIIILSGCTNDSGNMENQNNNPLSTITPVGEILDNVTQFKENEVTPLPTINERFVDFQSVIREDKAQVQQGDYIIIMGQIWASLKNQPEALEVPNNAIITIMKENQIVQKDIISLEYSGQTTDIAYYFTKKIDTKTLDPGMYNVFVLFDTGHLNELSFTVSYVDTDSRKCGSIICDFRELCCNGSCYNPLESICVNGTIVRNYDNLCPIGEEFGDIFQYCPGGYKCPDELLRFYHGPTCLPVINCGTFWCKRGEICCGDQCIPQISGGSKYFCGYQWGESDFKTCCS